MAWIAGLLLAACVCSAAGAQNTTSSKATTPAARVCNGVVEPDGCPPLATLCTMDTRIELADQQGNMSVATMATHCPVNTQFLALTHARLSLIGD